MVTILHTTYASAFSWHDFGIHISLKFAFKWLIIITPWLVVMSFLKFITKPLPEPQLNEFTVAYTRQPASMIN